MPTLVTTIAGKQFPNCVWTGSGSMTQQPSAILRWIDDGFGAVTPKTIAPNGCECVDPPDAWLPRNSTGGMAAGGVDWNCEGITRYPLERNIGIYKEVLDARPNAILIGSVLGIAESKQSWQDVLLPIAPYIKMAEANVSCPQNVIEKGAGAVIGRDPVLLARVVGWLKEILHPLGIPFSVKLTPSSDVVTLARVAADAGADALTCFNTYAGNLGFDPSTRRALPNTVARQGFGTNGAISGRAIHNISLELFRLVAMEMAKHAPHVALIASGGVEDLRTALNYLMYGASAVQVYSKLSPGIAQTIIADLLANMEAFGNNTLDEVRGTGFAKCLTSSGLVARVGGQGPDGLIPATDTN